MMYSSQDARSQFSDIISRAVFGGEPAVITRSGKQVAVIISYEDYLFYQELEDQYDGELAQKRLNQQNERISLEAAKASLGIE